jgi:hypothetical protein
MSGGAGSVLAMITTFRSNNNMRLQKKSIYDQERGKSKKSLKLKMGKVLTKEERKKIAQRIRKEDFVKAAFAYSISILLVGFGVYFLIY